MPAVVLGGEQAPDAELMELSTVPAGIAAEAHAYLAHGGPANLRQLARFLSDTVLLTGDGFEPPAPMPAWGPLDRPARAAPAAPGRRAPRRPWRSCTTGPTTCAGTPAFVRALADAVEAAGGRALPLFCSSLRTRRAGADRHAAAPPTPSS